MEMNLSLGKVMTAGYMGNFEYIYIHMYSNYTTCFINQIDY